MPRLVQPNGQVREYPYDAQGMAQYRQDKAAMDLQQQQGGQMRSEPGQMGYMDSMRQQPGASPHQADDMTAWHMIYDLMHNPALMAQIQAMQSQQLNQVVQPLRDMRNPHKQSYRDFPGEPQMGAGMPAQQPQGMQPPGMPPQAQTMPMIGMAGMGLGGQPQAESAQQLLQKQIPGRGQLQGRY